jgi:hypothetical protein
METLQESLARIRKLNELSDELEKMAKKFRELTLTESHFAQRVNVLDREVVRLTDENSQLAVQVSELQFECSELKDAINNWNAHAR